MQGKNVKDLPTESYHRTSAEHVAHIQSQVPHKLTAQQKRVIVAGHKGDVAAAANSGKIGKGIEEYQDLKAKHGGAKVAPAATIAKQSLPEFSKSVQKAVDSADAGGFGDNKVFIGHAYRQYVAGGGEPMGLPEFKSRLIEANQAGHLRLSRADLVQLMDKADVAESSASHPNVDADFHFVQAATKERHQGERGQVERLAKPATAEERKATRDALDREASAKRAAQKKKIALSAERYGVAVSSRAALAAGPLNPTSQYRTT